ncbi:MAG: hypothetical protein ABJA66_20120 [Actinomycetota bacterium]
MSKVESADLIMKLYDLRREEKMREARSWFVTFCPESMEEYMQATINPESSAKLRMVISYWDMAASFVNHGAIDEEMFAETAGEHIIVFSKVEPFLQELRETYGNLKFLANLEKLIMKQEGAKEMLASRREMIKRMIKARAEAAKG